MSVTYFTPTDEAYVVRVLALHRSLSQRSSEPARLQAYCFDAESHALLTEAAQPGLDPIPFAEVERDRPELLAVKPSRTGAEYMWTAKAAMGLDAFRRRPDAELALYADADLFFYCDPLELLAAHPDANLFVTPHRFAPHYRHLRCTGRFNAGFIGFRRSPVATACLEWWHERCLEWCHSFIEPGLYADQRYLEQWPARFGSVCELDAPTANVAPWNWDGHVLESPALGNGPLIDGAPIVFVHYHGVSQRSDASVDWAPGGYLIGNEQRRALLPAYEEALRAALDRVRAIRSGFVAGIASPPTATQRAERTLLSTASRLRRRFPRLVELQGGLGGRNDG